ncbi:MAG: hypothetical protein AUJ20_05165 [Comamonadaceae bacterium CG1_02_60_18]|nr:MAG: hypothetical protein AUJ20_05165 [Comamonadaceae bacterium CG1_02_60_18]PIQ51889.1 MAG: hypothetical protein COW02_12520 [Comamonadaceae bacterium CG12_big_fil_rev_8_21_14_0_65_59_15]
MMRGMEKTVAVGLVVLLLSACSNVAWYEGFKVRAANECNKQPPGAREDCLNQLNQQPYDTYQKERSAQP